MVVMVMREGAWGFRGRRRGRGERGEVGRLVGR